MFLKIKLNTFNNIKFKLINDRKKLLKRNIYSEQLISVHKVFIIKLIVIMYSLLNKFFIKKNLYLYFFFNKCFLLNNNNFFKNLYFFFKKKNINFKDNYFSINKSLPLKNKTKELITLIISPFIDKISREQFYKRIYFIKNNLLFTNNKIFYKKKILYYLILINNIKGVILEVKQCFSYI